MIQCWFSELQCFVTWTFLWWIIFCRSPLVEVSREYHTMQLMNQCGDGLDCLDNSLPPWGMALRREAPLASSGQGEHGVGDHEPPPPLAQPGCSRPSCWDNLPCFVGLLQHSRSDSERALSSCFPEHEASVADGKMSGLPDGLIEVPIRWCWVPLWHQQRLCVLFSFQRQEISHLGILLDRMGDSLCAPLPLPQATAGEFK